MPGLDFIPFDCDDPKHLAEFKRQRICCGWDFTDEVISVWLEDCRAGNKLIWWLFLDSGNLVLEPGQQEILNVQLEGQGTIAPLPPNADFQPIGHIALDWVDYKRDETLACRATGRVTVATFFILKSQQGKRYGSLAMDKVEAIAASEPHNAKVLTLCSIPAVNAKDPAYWKKFDRNHTEPLPTEEWYARRGYKPYKTEVRYQRKNNKGQVLDMDCVFMEKRIR